VSFGAFVHRFFGGALTLLESVSASAHRRIGVNGVGAAGYLL